MILSYQGRKTGRWRSLPCLYARDGQDLYVVPGQAGRKVWWRNLRQPTPVRLRVQGRDLEGIATASSDPEAVAVGLRRYLARYPKAARLLGVRLDANGTPHGTITAAHPFLTVTPRMAEATGGRGPGVKPDPLPLDASSRFLVNGSPRVMALSSGPPPSRPSRG